MEPKRLAITPNPNPQAQTRSDHPVNGGAHLRSLADVERRLMKAGFSIEESVGDNATDGTPAMLVARKRED
jgi:hypothetical protein